VSAWLVIQRDTGEDRRSVDEDGIADGACPGCGTDPFAVQTHPPEPYDSHTVRGGGCCVRCGDAVGWVYADAPTIFGAEEDDAVLHGRPRVYW
jgi:hypothetical protein